MSWVVGLAALAAVQGSPSLRFDLICDVERFTPDLVTTGDTNQERLSVDLITDRYCFAYSCSQGRWSEIDSYDDRQITFRDNHPRLTFTVNRLNGAYRFDAREEGRQPVLWLGECVRAPFTEHRRF